MRYGVLVQINSNGNIDGRALNLAGGFDWTKPLLNFAGNNFLPLGIDIRLFIFIKNYSSCS